MDKEEKIDFLVLCCAIILAAILSIFAYNFCMSKGVEYISRYVVPSLALALVFVGWVMFSCLILILMLSLYCLWKDDFTE